LLIAKRFIVSFERVGGEDSSCNSPTIVSSRQQIERGAMKIGYFAADRQAKASPLRLCSKERLKEIGT
jgi:hypothetical protein